MKGEEKVNHGKEKENDEKTVISNGLKPAFYLYR